MRDFLRLFKNFNFIFLVVLSLIITNQIFFNSHNDTLKDSFLLSAEAVPSSLPECDGITDVCGVCDGDGTSCLGCVMYQIVEKYLMYAMCAMVMGQVV